MAAKALKLTGNGRHLLGQLFRTRRLFAARGRLSHGTRPMGPVSVGPARHQRKLPITPAVVPFGLRN